MVRTGTIKATLIITICSLFLGCAGNKAKPTEAQYSGFLEDYSGLEKTEDVAGERVLRLISPKFTGDNYQKVMIDPLRFYPEPQPSEQVSAATLQELKDYGLQALRREVGGNMPVVDQPGPGVARMRVALTAVGAEAEGLRPYQYVPVALILTAGNMAVSGRPMQATVFLEAETVDSVTGERLAVAVRGGTGERLKRFRGSGQTLTADKLKPLFDRWAKAYADYLASVIQAE